MRDWEKRVEDKGIVYGLIPSRPKEHNLGVLFVHHPNRTSKPIIKHLLHIVPSEDLVEPFNLRAQAARSDVTPGTWAWVLWHFASHQQFLLPPSDLLDPFGTIQAAVDLKVDDKEVNHPSRSIIPRISQQRTSSPYLVEERDSPLSFATIDVDVSRPNVSESRMWSRRSSRSSF